jgi:hypothetical protein
VPDLGGGKPHGHIIKLEFSLRNDRLPAAEEITATLFPFAAPVRHQVPLLPYQIAMKLMTVTSEAAGGVPTRRQSVLPRQFYDLDGLFGVVRRDQWRDIASGVADLALRETRPVRSSDVWTGIQARLAEWAEGAERSRTVEIGAFSNEIRTGQRIPLSGWRTRCRRLAYAARCAEAGDAGAWVEATRIVAVLTKRDLPRIEARWRSERGTSPPRMGDTSAAALWWEYLATGGLPTPPR